MNGNAFVGTAILAIVILAVLALLAALLIGGGIGAVLVWLFH